MTLATAHAARDGDEPHRIGNVPARGTIVFYMGLGRIAATCRALVEAGRAAATPAAVVSHATRSDERLVTGTLTDIAARAEAAGLEGPALLVVGEVVARRVESPAAPARDVAGEDRAKACSSCS